MTTRRIGRRNSGSRWVILALVALAGLYFARGFLGRLSKTYPPNAFYQVKRADMLISIVEDGALRALNETVVRNSLEGVNRIIYLVPEGSYVQKGDLLVELDSAGVKEKLNEQELQYQERLFQMLQATGNLEIQKSLVESQIKDAELKVENAEVDLAKYREGDAPLLLKTIEARSGVLTEQVRIARDRYARTEELFKGGNASKSELEADALSLKREQLALGQYQEDLRLVKKYDQPNQLRLLASNVEQAKAELDRLRQRTSNEISQAEADMKTSQAALEFLEEGLKMQRRRLENTKILAPQNGLAVYASVSMFAFAGDREDRRRDEGRSRGMRGGGFRVGEDGSGEFRFGGRRGNRGGMDSSSGGVGSSSGGGNGGLSSRSSSSSTPGSTAETVASGNQRIASAISGSSVTDSSGSGANAGTGGGSASSGGGGGRSGGGSGGSGGSATSGGGSAGQNTVSAASVFASYPSMRPSSAFGASSASTNSGGGSANSGTANSSASNENQNQRNQGSSGMGNQFGSRSGSMNFRDFGGFDFYGTPGILEEGAMVRQRQELIRLPDVTKMLAEIKIEEARAAQIRPGMAAYIHVKNIPHHRFKGAVRRVAPLPDSQASWMNPNVKVFPADILVEEELPILKPGVSVSTEIIITNLTKVLSVPIQTVARVQGQNVCFVKRGSRVTPVPVTTGWFNESFIEVTAGLKEGDFVLLAPVGDDETEETQPEDTNNVETVTTPGPQPSAPVDQPPAAEERRFQRRNEDGPPENGAPSGERRRDRPGAGRRPQNSQGAPE
jgi:multidrug resistance efflux pump